MNLPGMRSSAASSSSENRGHSRENEQHAPHARQMEATSSGTSIAAVIITVDRVAAKPARQGGHPAGGVHLRPEGGRLTRINSAAPAAPVLPLRSVPRS